MGKVEFKVDRLINLSFTTKDEMIANQFTKFKVPKILQKLKPYVLLSSLFKMPQRD